MQMQMPITYRELLVHVKRATKPEIIEHLNQIGDRVLSGEQFFEIPKKAVDATDIPATTGI